MDVYSGLSGSVFAVDIDGDADLDVVAVFLVGMYPFDGEFIWWENEDGAGTNWIEHYVSYPSGVTRCCPADIDSDGDSDVVIGAEGTEWWENVDSGATWIGHNIDVIEYARWLDAADMDGDTDVDVLYAGYSDDLGWLEQTEDSAGIMRWVKHEVVNTFYGAQLVHAADMDGDTDVDIVGAAEADAELTWWEVMEFKPAGELVSTILDVECDPDWHLINWTWDAPANTSVRFQVRVSDDYTNMGEWSQEMNSPGSLHGILADRDNYVQYKAILESTNPGVSPTLEDIIIRWNPLGIEEEVSEYLDFVLQPVLPNPVFELATISFTIPHDCHVSLKVFDVSGRLVTTLVEEYVHAGKHTVVFETHDLTNGVYYYRLEAGTFIQTGRCVVVR